MRDINWLRQQAQAQSLGGPQNASPVRTKPNPTTPSPSRAGAATNAGVVGTPAPTPANPAATGGQNAPVTHMTLPDPTNQPPVNPGLINDFTVTPTPVHNDGPGPGITPRPPNNLTFRDNGYARFDSGHGIIGGGHDGRPGSGGTPEGMMSSRRTLSGNYGPVSSQWGNWQGFRDSLMGKLQDIFG